MIVGAMLITILQSKASRECWRCMMAMFCGATILSMDMAEMALPMTSMMGDALMAVLN